MNAATCDACQWRTSTGDHFDKPVEDARRRECKLIPDDVKPCLSDPATLTSSAAPDEPQPIDLHALYRQQSACGYLRPLNLSAHSASGIAARLRGITAAACVLTAANDGEMLDIGPFIHAGLVEAIAALASSATSILEHHNERAADAANTTR